MVLTKIPGSLITDATITSADIQDSTITNAKMVVDPSNASNLSSGDVPLAQLGNVPDPNLSPALDDIALLAFKTQANGNLARYNLVDQSVDAFEDASGVNAPASTDASRDSSGKYYFGEVNTNATGGNIASYTSGATTYTVHSFLANGNFVPPSSGNIDAMLVGGGGGGGKAQGGGGGGGGMVAMTNFPVTATTYAIVIGAGGAGADYNTQPNSGEDGDPTTGFGETATGGGGGSFAATGRPGASGGGGGEPSHAGGTGTVPSVSSPTATGYGGYNGGTGAVSQGAGGAGLGQAGSNGGAGSGPRNAGNGRQHNIDGNNYYWGGGGGGASWGYDGGLGGTGGGGGGGGQSGPAVGGAGGGSALNAGNPGFDYGNPSSGGTTGGNGGANTGGGGGGGNTSGPSWTPTTQAAGGSGIVQVRYPNDTFASLGDMTLVSNSITAQAAPTKGDLVFTYSNGAGTAAVGTNITAEISMDGGTTWTNTSIAPGDVQGTTGGHTIVTKNNVSLTSTSGTSMRYRIKTLVQSVSLSTRIHAVSLGWS